MTQQPFPSTSPRPTAPRRGARRLAAVGLAGVLAVSAAAVTGCSSGETASPGSSQAAAGSPHRAPQDFAAAASEPGTVVLDVRTPEEYAAGHLPGAVNLDSSAADFRDKLEALDQGAPYAVYCHSGRRSGAALDVMGDLGFTRAYDLAGGIGAWTASGGEVVVGS